MPTLRTTLTTLYLIFFATHPLTVLIIDAYTLYPSSLLTTFPSLSFLRTLNTYYTTTYRDLLASPATRPAWFTFYLWQELLLHVPLSLWATGRLWGELRASTLKQPLNSNEARGREPVDRKGVVEQAKTALPLLLFSLQTVLTTGTCIAEVLSWKTHSREEKARLMGLYVPYCVFAGVLGVDMWGRVRRGLAIGSRLGMGEEGRDGKKRL